MVPVIVHRLPLEPDTGWRVVQVAGNAAAGTMIAVAAATLSPGYLVPVLATVMAQSSYGFTFTAYDPYTADPLVFLFAALLIWCWITDRPWLAVALSTIGIFAKETVAIFAAGIAIAAMLERREGWRRWLAPAAASAIGLAVYHLVGETWLNWDISTNPAAQLQNGSWLGLWWRNNPFIERKAYMIFATFGFAWAFAVMGWRTAPPPWRAVAIGTIAPMAALMIVQTPERALGNAFYVVIPLAALFASRSPAPAGIAIGLNALVTAKAGSSSAWLPSGRWTLIPAAVAAGLLVISAQRKGNHEDSKITK